MHEGMREINYSQCFEKNKKMIKDTYDYFDVANLVWWEYFFNDQIDIILRSRNEVTLLNTPFILR